MGHNILIPPKLPHKNTPGSPCIKIKDFGTSPAKPVTRAPSDSHQRSLQVTANGCETRVAERRSLRGARGPESPADRNHNSADPRSQKAQEVRFEEAEGQLTGKDRGP